jgi:hypothetical protein
VRVEAGEAFGISALIAPGWFIDAVEAVDWQADPGPDAADAAESGRALPAIDTTRAIDWRVVRTPGVAELRIDLAEAATRNRSLGLRIKGHRRGVPLGGTFVTADMDMVRLDGEAPGNALLDFRVGPEAVVEIDGSPIGILAAEGRFAPLVEPGSARARIPGGVRAAAREARLVQRRPPLDADVQVQLVARDGQIAESTTVTCRPDAGTIDSVVVHFSEPLGDAVAWTLLSPEGTTAVPRRLEAAEAGPRSRLPRGIAESWLVELRPAVEAAVTLRASRTRPFAAPLPVSLAWVEGATEDRGTLVVRGAAGGRPAVVNRQLWELPPEAAESGDAAGVVAEFRYAGPDSFAAGDAPPAEVVPVSAAEARAWAWHERTTAWCHEAGRTEFESVYDVENRGRGELVLAVPPGTTLREIAIDGETASFDATRASAADVGIELPADRVRCELVVRGELASAGGAGVRRVELRPCTIDAPILGRQLTLMVPPALEVIGHGPASEPRAGVLARLFDAARVGEAATVGSPGGAIGFRRVEIAPAAVAARTVLVVRRDLLASTAMLVWIFAAALAAWAVPRAGAAVLLGCCAAALAALWIDETLVVVARAAWWGAITGGALGLTQRPTVAALVAATMLAGGAPQAAAAEPWRVYFPADDPGVALVPEPLHRLLAADDAAAAAAVRVRSSSLRVPTGESGGWALALEIEADRGGVLVVRQSEGCRWAPAGDAVAGAVVDVTADGREARIVATAPGTRMLTLGVVPTPIVRGMVESFDVALPPAPRAEVIVAEPVVTGGWQCDRGDAGGSWSPARTLDDRFDVSRAVAVRLVRSRDPRHPLAANVRDERQRGVVVEGLMPAAGDVRDRRRLLDDSRGRGADEPGASGRVRCGRRRGSSAGGRSLGRGRRRAGAGENGRRVRLRAAARRSRGGVRGPLCLDRGGRGRHPHCPLPRRPGVGRGSGTPRRHDALPTPGSRTGARGGVADRDDQRPAEPRGKRARPTAARRRRRGIRPRGPRDDPPASRFDRRNAAARRGLRHRSRGAHAGGRDRFARRAADHDSDRTAEGCGRRRLLTPAAGRRGGAARRCLRGAARRGADDRRGAAASIRPVFPAAGGPRARAATIRGGDAPGAVG